MGSENALNIKNPETVRLARELAARTGESLTAAVTQALRDRLGSVSRPSGSKAALAGVERIQELVASLPELDRRSAEEILGYDEFGLPG
jgi:antitoxin VapB